MLGILALNRLLNISILPYFIGRGRYNPTAKRSLPRTTAYGRYSNIKLYQNYLPVQDRRTFHPLGSDRPLQTTSGKRVRIIPKMRSSQRADTVPAALGFMNPARVLICARRQRRKQVMHALGIAGGTGFKPPRFNWTSNYTCE